MLFQIYLLIINKTWIYTFLGQYFWPPRKPTSFIYYRISF